MSSRVNFTNILRAAFAHTDPKSVKRQSSHQYFSVLIGSAWVKDYVTQVTHLLVFDCKIGDFKIAGCVCLQKKVCLLSLLRGIFW